MSGQPDAPRVPGGTDAGGARAEGAEAVETSAGSEDELAREGRAARVEEARARDHRKLGRELKLFMFSELSPRPGVNPAWPNFPYSSIPGSNGTPRN